MRVIASCVFLWGTAFFGGMSTDVWGMECDASPSNESVRLGGEKTPDSEVKRVTHFINASRIARSGAVDMEAWAKAKYAMRVICSLGDDSPRINRGSALNVAEKFALKLRERGIFQRHEEADFSPYEGIFKIEKGIRGFDPTKEQYFYFSSVDVPSSFVTQYIHSLFSHCAEPVLPPLFQALIAQFEQGSPMGHAVPYSLRQEKPLGCPEIDTLHADILEVVDSLCAYKHLKKKERTPASLRGLAYAPACLEEGARSMQFDRFYYMLPARGSSSWHEVFVPALPALLLRTRQLFTDLQELPLLKSIKQNRSASLQDLGVEAVAQIMKKGGRLATQATAIKGIYLGLSESAQQVWRDLGKDLKTFRGLTVFDESTVHAPQINDDFKQFVEKLRQHPSESLA